MNEPKIKTSWLGRVAATLVGLLFLAILSEILLRVFMPNWREYHSGRFMTVVDAAGGGTVGIALPGFDGWFAQNNGDFRVRIRINDAGLRNDEPVAAADGRIWVIGDSMSFGWGVERNESYTQVLSDTLKFPAYNLATPGSGVCGWQAVYGRMPENMRPAAVVIGLTIENRAVAYDCLAAAKSIPQSGQDYAYLFSIVGIKWFLTEHLALYNFFTVSLKRVGLAEKVLEKAGLIEPAHRVRYHQDDAGIAKAVSTTADELRRLRAMAPADRPFLVVLFPARFEIRDDDAHYRRLRVELAAALAARGIQTLDLFPDFKTVGLDATHFAHDGHWNVTGHRLAGQTIARWIAAGPANALPRPFAN